MREITIENVGPIERLAIPLPEAGVVILRGRNGAGKSHALAAVDSLISGRGRPPCRDGTAKGTVEGAGVRLTIGRSTRRIGEAEVMTLEGRLDISQLVSPPIKDEESADRTRIKALIQLSGVSADPQAFQKILPQNLELGELVPAQDLVDDPVTVAGKIKRALEAEARRHEKAAEDYAAKAAAFRDQIKGESPSGYRFSREEAEAQLQEALLRLKELQTRAEEAARQREKIAQAQAQLAKLQKEGGGEVSIAQLESELSNLDEKVQQLEKALVAARERRKRVAEQLEQAKRLRAEVEELERLIAEVPRPVDETAIADASKAVIAAKAQHQKAIETEQARQLLAQANSHAEASNEELAAAAVLRDAAHATDDVLTEFVNRVTKRLRVEGGRLVCDTERGAEPFSELSPGERWRIALEIAVEQVGKGGLVTVPQEAWESLDPINREEIARIAHEIGVVILTAESDSRQAIQAEVL